jgi:CxxC-x17-CxxC domain-containing protein
MSTHKKSTTSKKTKTKSPSPSVTADQDIVGLLTVLVQKLTSFETKIDTVLSRIPSQPSVALPPKTSPASIQEHHKKPRPMYGVICSDCGKESSVPFKPSGDRPVYCQECFLIRKKKGNITHEAEARPQQQPQPEEKLPEKPKALKAIKKKTALKKKKPAKKNKK